MTPYGGAPWSSMWNAAQKSDEAFWRARAARARATTSGGGPNERIQDLEDEVGSLLLVVRALSEMLRSKGLFDETAFREAMQRIDLEDGVLDGKVTRPEPVPPPVQDAPTPGRRRRS